VYVPDQLSSVTFFAVIRTQPANPAVAPFVVCGKLTPVEVHRLWDWLVGFARVEERPIDVEITLAGDQKEMAAGELAERLIGLSYYNITLRVG
jgi:hypothetical protein